MFTTQFKVLISIVLLLGFFSAVIFNQLGLNKRIKALENSSIAKPVVVVVTPTVAPTATPSSTLRFVPKVTVTTVPKTLVK